MIKYAFFKMRSYKKHKKVPDFVVFILKMFQELFFFAVFFFQKIAENHKIAKTSDYKIFFACEVFSYKGWANSSLYSRVFWWSNLLARPRLSTQEMNPQNQTTCSIKKQQEALAFVLFYLE